MKKQFLSVAFFAFVLARPAFAEVKVAAVFSDHMVLQRDMPIPLWGTASPGEKVTVEVAGQSRSTTTDAGGKWLVKLDPLNACATPRGLKVGQADQWLDQP